MKIKLFYLSKLILENTDSKPTCTIFVEKLEINFVVCVPFIQGDFFFHFAQIG